jgi:hypothetical protein
MKTVLTRYLVVLASILTLMGVALPAHTFAAEENGSIGLEGRINSAPPTQAATISFPRDGATVTDLPVTVSGICPKGLLVKLFKNNVFAGSQQCVSGSFSIQIDLFTGRNELVARVYDDLDQSGPDSNTVAVTFPVAGFSFGTRISLTSSFAKKGANPSQKLIWPVTLTGGNGPYAVTVDWGDGKKTDVMSLQFAGTFNIEHTYDTPGIYNVVVRAADKDGNLAFLQLVGVANGPLTQSNAQADQNNDAATKTTIKVLWQPALVSIPLLFATFWLGKRYELFVLRKSLERREK